MRYPAIDRFTFSKTGRPFGVADQMLAGLEDYTFPLESVSHYPQEILDEIAHGVHDVKRIGGIKTKFLFRPTKKDLISNAIDGQDPLERDQAVWQLIGAFPEEAAEVVIRSIETAPTRELKLSALIALSKLAHLEQGKVFSQLEKIGADTAEDIEIVEWARVLRNDIGTRFNGIEALNNAMLERDFVYDPDAIFDVTMPLTFHCHAFTKVGPTTWHTVIGPEWFALVFGRAKALVRSDTYLSNLVLEKTVPGLHADGSPHYEHFPFGGTSEALASNVFRHNYWAKLYRPYYTSGRVEKVSADEPVLRSVPQTFARAAVTAAPQRYQTEKGSVAESVRGMFFGYGHIDPSVLARNRLNVRAGEFQLAPRTNPATGKLSNTYFFGTFYGKLADLDGDGKLDVNTIPVHCDAQGQLDYEGNGAMKPDPVAPLDWTNQPA